MTRHKLVGLFLCVLTAMALAQNAAVAERALAAGWFAYKFAGYGNDGYIMLGWSTAKWFYALSFLATVASCVCALAWNPRSRAGRVLRWLPSTLFSLGVVAYTAVAFSPLNRWRP